MSEVIDMQKAKTTLSRLVERALAGEDVIIGRNGKPLVRLVPIPARRPPRTPGKLKGQIWILPDFEFTDEKLDDFERPL